mmetsp:Transcript_30820/g.91559  ORF Transcript_30820/g.91559 Transcript_30820/m.91559 type:complete len:213 (+) Transcript_30820:376-1014(+)
MLLREHQTGWGVAAFSSTLPNVHEGRLPLSGSMGKGEGQLEQVNHSSLLPPWVLGDGAYTKGHPSHLLEKLPRPHGAPDQQYPGVQHQPILGGDQMEPPLREEPVIPAQGPVPRVLAVLSSSGCQGASAPPVAVEQLVVPPQQGLGPALSARAGAPLPEQLPQAVGVLPAPALAWPLPLRQGDDVLEAHVPVHEEGVAVHPQQPVVLPCREG